MRKSSEGGLETTATPEETVHKRKETWHGPRGGGGGGEQGVEDSGLGRKSAAGRKEAWDRLSYPQQTYGTLPARFLVARKVETRTARGKAGCGWFCQVCKSRENQGGVEVSGGGRLLGG